MIAKKEFRRTLLWSNNLDICNLLALLKIPIKINFFFIKALFKQNSIRYYKKNPPAFTGGNRQFCLLLVPIKPPSDK